jgi:hypothetical protein
VLAEVSPAPGSLSDAVPESEYTRLLGLPRGRGLDGLSAERALEARRWYGVHGRPWAAARRLAIASLSGETITLENGHAFRSEALAERLRAEGARALAVLAATAGEEVENEARRLWQAGRPDEAYFLDRLGAAVAEQLVAWASVWVCRQAEASGETATAHLSPGCGDWPLGDQRTLMAALAGGSKVGPLQLLPSSMLRPTNSLLAAVGLTRRRVAPTPADACRSCDLTPCGFRRAAYRGAA